MHVFLYIIAAIAYLAYANGTHWWPPLVLALIYAVFAADEWIRRHRGGSE